MVSLSPKVGGKLGDIPEAGVWVCRCSLITGSCVGGEGRRGWGRGQGGGMGEGGGEALQNQWVSGPALLSVPFQGLWGLRAG